LPSIFVAEAVDVMNGAGIDKMEIASANAAIADRNHLMSESSPVLNALQVSKVWHRQQSKAGGLLDMDTVVLGDFNRVRELDELACGRAENK
jgi:hypothetical protein